MPICILPNLVSEISSLSPVDVGYLLNHLILWCSCVDFSFGLILLIPIFHLEIFLKPKIFTINLGFLSFHYFTTIIIIMLLTKTGNMHYRGFQWQ